MYIFLDTMICQLMTEDAELAPAIGNTEEP